jgi:phosphoribosylformimino-5-aminoimidazole carboxamide ribotide isomerase
MQVIPAVDLVGANATRLEQGDFNRALFERPAEAYVAEVAATRPPLIHLVDLDGARTGEFRPDVIAACLRAAGPVPVQVSGGVRDVERARALIELGAARVLIGTAAFAERELLDEFVNALGERLAVTIDVRDGLVKVAGWLESTMLTVDDAATRCVDAGVARVLGTSIARDGTGAGPDLDLYRTLCAHPLKVIAAGGVRDRDDVDALAAIGCEGAVTGRAFAEGRLRT